MEEKKTGCTVQTASVSSSSGSEKTVEDRPVKKEDDVMTVMVGKKAPDFTAPAFHKDKFTQVKLSDHLGKWVLLCFYPGDFTFV